MKSGLGRIILLGALALMLAIPALAQTDYRAWSPDNGITVRQGYHIEWFRSMARDGNGNLCLAWSDTRKGGRDIYAQLISPTGEVLWNDDLWGLEGKTVADTFSRQEDPHVMATDDGYWIVTWIDYRWDIHIEDIGDVYMQKLDADGMIQWDTEDSAGVPVAVVDPSLRIAVQSFPDGEGGAVAVWVDGRNGSADIYAQRIDSDGNPVWDVNGICVAGGFEDQADIGGGGYTADTDGDGGIIVAWVDDRTPTNKNILAQRVDVDGNLLWSPEDLPPEMELSDTGLVICAAELEQSGIKLAPDGLGGAFFMWHDKRIDLQGDLYGQRVDADGNVLWTENGEIVCDAMAKQEKQRIVNTAPGEAITVWQDQRVDFFTNDLYMQHITGDDVMELHWAMPDSAATLGIPLCTAEGHQEAPRVTPDEQGGVIITWTDERVNQKPREDLYGDRVNEDGEFLWSNGETGGIVIADADLAQNGNILRILDQNVGIVWFDYRKGSPGIYCQVTDIDGNIQLDPNGIEIIFGIDYDGIKPRVIYNGSDLYIGWKENRKGGHGTYPYIQKIDPINGDNLFDINGITLTPGLPSGELEIEVDSVNFTINDQNEVFAAWQDNRHNYFQVVSAQKMNSDGTVLWGDEGMEIAPPLQGDSRDQSRPRILPAPDGGLYVVFIKTNDDWWQNIHMQRLDPNGVPLWDYGDPYGLRITNETSDFTIEDMQFRENGNILLVYSQNVEQGNYDLLAQTIDPDGNLVWGDPIFLSQAPGFQFHAKTGILQGSSLVVWEDTRRDTLIDIYGQCIREGGSFVWDDVDGRPLVAADKAQNKIDLGIKDDGASTFWLTWQDTRIPNDPDIYVQRFNLQGEPLFDEPDGIQISASVRNQDWPKIVVGNDHDAYVAWEEFIEDLNVDLYYTHVDPNGVTYPSYTEGGLVLCDAYHQQLSVNMEYYVDLPTSYGGFIATWEDLRSTGKDPLVNIFAQEVIDGYVGVEEHRTPVPSEWELNAAYPNPFNPATRISFNVGEAAHVKLTVYDILGRRVAVLLQDRLKAGEHQVHWDGRDFSGRLVASGTYFYTLESDGIRLVRNVILLK